MNSVAKSPGVQVSKRRWPRRALLSVNALVLVMLVAAGSAYGYVRWQLGKVNHISVGGLAPPTPGAMTILAVGSDTRNLGAGASAAFGSVDSVTGQRSDTIMLIHIVPATSSVAIMSIPRDLMVPIAGMGTTRINAAFNTGPSLLVSTISQDLGIKINHFMVVNFYSFTKIADSLGGVYQYFPAPARDAFSLLKVPNAGCVLLKGANALGFVRSREYQYYLNGTWQYQLSPESDLARIQRQQAFIKLAVKRAEHIDPANLGALNSVLSGITSSLTVDNNFSTSLMLQLANTFRHTNVTGIANWTYPTVNSVAVPGALDPVPSEDQAMVQQFLHYGLPAGPSTTSTNKVTATPTATATASASAPTGVVTPSATAGATLSLALDVWTADGNPVASSSPSTSTPASQGLTTPNDEIYPDASSFYHGQYIPPGRSAGQVPQTCPT